MSSDRKQKNIQEKGEGKDLLIQGQIQQLLAQNSDIKVTLATRRTGGAATKLLSVGDGPNNKSFSTLSPVCVLPPVASNVGTPPPNSMDNSPLMMLAKAARGSMEDRISPNENSMQRLRRYDSRVYDIENSFSYTLDKKWLDNLFIKPQYKLFGANIEATYPIREL